MAGFRYPESGALTLFDLAPHLLRTGAFCGVMEHSVHRRTGATVGPSTPSGRGQGRARVQTLACFTGNKHVVNATYHNTGATPQHWSRQEHVWVRVSSGRTILQERSSYKDWRESIHKLGVIVLGCNVLLCYSYAPPTTVFLFCDVMEIGSEKMIASPIDAADARTAQHGGAGGGGGVLDRGGGGSADAPRGLRCKPLLLALLHLVRLVLALGHGAAIRVGRERMGNRALLSLLALVVSCEGVEAGKLLPTALALEWPHSIV